MGPLVPCMQLSVCLYNQVVRRGFFYLLDYVTSTKIFQIGDHKKTNMNPIYRKFYRS